MAKPKGLGRGLDSLLSGGIEAVGSDDRLTQLPLADIRPGRYQPRSQMDDDSLAELAESIRAQGVIQPVIVREQGLSSYELIAGERRWRASQLAGLSEIPAVIKNISDENALAIGLIENIQRQNLNPIEEAVGLKRLVDEFGLTHDAVAQAVGRSRSSITNSLRLLNLAEPVQELLYSRQLDMGHARALLPLPVLAQIDLAQKAARQGWSVREVERKSRRAQENGQQQRKTTVAGQPEIIKLQERASDLLSMPVSIRMRSAQEGKVSIEFSSLDELQYLLERLGCRFEAE